VQIGVALLGGHVRVGLTVSASALPIEPGSRAFTNLVVSMPLPTGVQLTAADNPGWSCTAQGTCTIASLASGATTSSVLTLAIAADATAPISFAPSVTTPPGAVVQSQPLTIAPETVAGLQIQEFARGSVTAIGNTALDCVVFCSYVGTSTADLAITGTVAKAVLVWSGVSGNPNRDHVQLTLPNSNVIGIAADSFVDRDTPGYTGAYLAFADVTAQVTTAGTYAVAGLQTNTFPLVPIPPTYGGWSLLVITHDSTQPQRSLMITVPATYVGNTTPYSLIPGGSISGTADAHVIALAFQATSSLLGSALHFNGFELTDPFHSAIASVPRSPQLADNFGVDLLDVTAVDVGAGSGMLDFASTNQLLLGAVALAIDLS